jgi:hypothetical protein
MCLQLDGILASMSVLGLLSKVKEIRGLWTLSWWWLAWWSRLIGSNPGTAAWKIKSEKESNHNGYAEPKGKLDAG